ncbi:hypothetical protein GCM10009087_48140 [Sphingomonas oligophenolica]
MIQLILRKAITHLGLSHSDIEHEREGELPIACEIGDGTIRVYKKQADAIGRQHPQLLFWGGRCPTRLVCQFADPVFQAADLKATIKQAFYESRHY